jgi:glycosidase
MVDAGTPPADAGQPLDAGQPIDAGTFSWDAGACPPPPPPGDFRDETIYFLMTTRFFDGDPSNNFYNRDRVQLGDPTWRGDFKGLIAQLDYLHDTLGFTALWITPVVENRSGLDYHGYHGYDFTRVDPRLESPGATFQDLICEVHRRGMKLVLDVVFNHTSSYGLRGQVHNLRAPTKYYRESGAFPSATPGYPYQVHLGDYVRANREDDDNPLAPQVFRDVDPLGARAITCPVCGQVIPVTGYAGFRNHDPNHFFSVQPTRLDATWYHQAGFIAGGDWENPWALQQKHLAGDAIDLNTENPVVRQYVVEAYGHYLDLGVDALRVDTVKHLERGNLLDYVNALKARKPGLFVFGEDLVKGTGWGTCLDSSDNGPAQIRPWWYTRTTNDPCGAGHDDSGFSVLDFSLFSTFRDNLSQGNFSGLGGVYARDGLYGDATKLVTFLDNHDLGPQNDWKYRFNGSDQALASALNLLFLARGIPAVFYGTEVRFQAGAEIDGTDAPHATSGRAYFGDRLLPANLPATRAHPFVAHLKRLNQLRAASPALRRGWLERFGDNGNSAWFVRNDGAGHVAAVGLSQGGDTLTINNLPAGTWRDAVSGATQVLGPGGALSFHVNNGSAAVWLLEGPGKVGVDGAWLR